MFAIFAYSEYNLLPMKRILLACMAVVAAWGLSAQNPYFSPLGTLVDADGTISYTEPHTTLAVDVTVTADRTIAGPYARYAQKYLGLRAPLVDRVVWSVVGGDVALLSDEELMRPAALAAPRDEVMLHAVGTVDEFAHIQPDKRTLLMPETEEAASEAAQQIFSLRKHRQELITGEAGENVFGEGLKAALQEIARQEQALLELFLGKQISTTESRRFVVYPDASKRQYVVARFSAEEGLLPANDLLGDMVLLQLEPQPAARVGADIVEADVKDLSTASVLVANRVTCKLSVAGKYCAEKVLPIFEFGRKLTIPVQRRK